MINVEGALMALGVERVIWIDDRFCDTPDQLARMLTIDVEITRSCKFSEFEKALSVHDIDIESSRTEFRQALAKMTKDRFAEVRDQFFSASEAAQVFSNEELSANAMEKACALLGVAEADRWTFDTADRELEQVCSSGDGQLGYVVDLNEAGGAQSRGLDVLHTLNRSGASGTAFILTHETDIAGEGIKEIEVRRQLSDLNGLGIPICVIAKERLYDKAEDEAAMADALRIGIKRAGLRRSIHDVLAAALGSMQAAVVDAANGLLSITPEKLESHVFERGYIEGVSELHVVERAITAHFGNKAREFFATNAQVRESVKRLRQLRSISLENSDDSTDEQLSAFREAEVWESEKIVNGSLAPIACGDLFELDREEKATKNSNRKFIVLGQPCDLSLRPNEGARSQETAFLIPLKQKKNSDKIDPKAPLLPFILHGTRWACDFRNATTVKLSILDLASFRKDGRVRVDADHFAAEELLAAQAKVYSARTAWASECIADGKVPAGDTDATGEMFMTFDTRNHFKHIFKPVLEEGTEMKVDGRVIEKPKRITWRLRRCGRVRMPYSAALLDQYVTVMSRQAFDLDFMLPLT